MELPPFPGRPDHPDINLIAEGVYGVDNPSDSGKEFTEIIKTVVDPESLLYIAKGRAELVAMKIGLGVGVMKMMLKMAPPVWVDGFLAGALYQQAKDKQEKKD